MSVKLIFKFKANINLLGRYGISFKHKAKLVRFLINKKVFV